MKSNQIVKINNQISAYNIKLQKLSENQEITKSVQGNHQTNKKENKINPKIISEKT